MGHVWLVGMMGSGKTTVGAMVAEMLELPFVDTDSDVVTATGRTIAEMFDEGEHVFREAETRVLSSVASRERSVVSTGGGAILSEENVSTMRRSGTIVLLDVDVATIVERIDIEDERPLLRDEAAIAAILAERTEIYETVADHVVSVMNRTPQNIADEVAACVDM